ncbi:hypothetical protein MXM41_12240 [Leclercia adecarboxylata]|uniref:hypothetical protein n=1 Tax=Leclercia adecarboxylata TaxID=83655 RepID=UPI002DBE95DB|nr:hypothetical protein [Leclercia adecarboxylata]MEB6379693.1 hypothetical protein [Leclercia adecarboxylata]
MKWIVYGRHPQILDAGHVVELMLKNDLNELVYRTTRGKLLNPLVAACSRKTVATFMESEAHQEMLDANRKGKSGDMLREAMNRGVTTTYIDEALTSLQAVTQAVQNWSVVKWALFSAVIIYLFIPLMAISGSATLRQDGSILRRSCAGIISIIYSLPWKYWRVTVACLLPSLPLLSLSWGIYGAGAGSAGEWASIWLSGRLIRRFYVAVGL